MTGARLVINLRSNIAVQFLVVALLVTVATTVLHPRIGVTDSDAYSYVVGAYSIQQGNGYTSLDGAPLNHFPPGYSLLLALFPVPLQAALAINYLSLGLASGLVYLLARKSDWHWMPALGLAMALGFGFFSGIGTFARPDILTYTLFLLAVFLFGSANSRLQILSYGIWNILIPLKLIAIVFTPAALLVEWLAKDKSSRFKDLHKPALILLGYLATVGAIVIFNILTINQPIPATHGQSSLGIWANAIARFVETIPREFLAYWHGSIQNPLVLVPFCISLALAAWCLMTLRPYAKGNQLRNLAIAVLALSFVLVLVRQFDAGVRLTGYGLLVLFFAFRPATANIRRLGYAWLGYASISFALSAANATTVNSLGINDPRYQAMAYELSSAGLPRETIFTNSYHILDIHTRYATRPTQDLELLGEGAYFLQVTLPNYDGVATIIQPMSPPGSGWCQVVAVPGATLFHKC